MEVDGNAAAVVPDRDGIIFLQGDGNFIAESPQMLIHGVVHNLIDQMVDAGNPDAADIHTRTAPDGLQSLQDGDTARIILFCCILFHTKPFLCRNRDIKIPAITVRRRLRHRFPG